MKTPPRSAEANYRPDIDGLRAVAVAAVVGYHAFPETFRGGFAGVDIFFVISGYLITSIILGGLVRGNFSVARFYARRIRRLFPALFAVLAVCWVAGEILLLDDEQRALARHIAASAGFIANLAFWQEAGYFDAAAGAKPLLHLWSLAVEEQFYLIWPLLLWLAVRLGRDLPTLLVAIIVLSFIYGLDTLHTDPAGAFYSPLTRFWELASGGLLARLTLHNRERLARLGVARREAIAYGGVLLLAAGFLVSSSDSPYPGWRALLPVGGTTLLILAGAGASPNRHLLATRGFVWLGLISYPLYLWHWPLLSFAFITNEGTSGPVGAPARILLVLTAIGLAWLTYKSLETPIRAGRARKAAVPVLIGLLASVGVASAWFYGRLQGTPSPWTLAPTGRTPAERAAASIMLLGDSHAAHLFPGLRRELGPAIADFSGSGCIPFYDVDRYDARFPRGFCSGHMGFALHALEANEHMHTIVLASMGPVYLTGQTFKGMLPERIRGQRVVLETNANITDPWLIYEMGMRATLARLVARGKRVVFVIDIPELGFAPRFCSADRAVSVLGWVVRGTGPCVVPRSEHDARADRYRTLVLSILADFPSVIRFDPTDLFCDGAACRALVNGIHLYRDSDHLSLAGSSYVARYLAPLLRPR